MSTPTIRTAVLPNITISACKLRTPYQGNYGQQYGAVLEGEGLAELGLSPTEQGGFWYNTNAMYGKTNTKVPPVSIQDMDGNEITEDLQNGAVAHLLVELRDYEAGVRGDGTKHKKGTNVRIVAVRAISFDLKKSQQDALSAGLLELGSMDDASVPF